MNDVYYEADFDSAVMRVLSDGVIMHASRLETDPERPGVPVLQHWVKYSEKFSGRPEEAKGRLQTLEARYKAQQEARVAARES